MNPPKAFISVCAVSCLLTIFATTNPLLAQTATAKSLVAQAVAAFNKGDYEKTVTLCKKAIAADAKYVRAYTWLGTAYAKLKKDDLAREAFKKVLSLQPKGPDADLAKEALKKLESSTPPDKPATVTCSNPKCAKETDATAVFCKHCGTKLKAESPSPPTTKISLFEGTKIRVELAEELSSRRAKKGQEVRYYVKDDVWGPNREVLIRQGAAVTGIVTEAKSAGGLGRKGKLEFTVESVVAVDGTKVPLRARQNAAGKGQGGAVAAGVILFGVFGGFIKGNNVTIDKGTVFDAFIDRTVEIEVKNPPQSK